MNELVFRGKDLFRPSKPHLIGAACFFLLAVSAGLLRSGPVFAAWSLAAVLVLFAPVFYSSWRGWSRVGPDGVTICWGFGAGRTYSWQEIRWVDVRETPINGVTGGGGTARAARIFTTTGRRRSLPGLAWSPMYPARDFDVNVRRLRDWWESSTEEAQRVRPAKQFRDRLTPTTVAIVALVLIAVVGWFVIASRY
ncbi:hypothetical protein [Streptomyces sp. CBMA123]|uniref:hypothetical protein n=1 Tax=Streptomyces sp. CBMA123 TaxID=1896313 RepID=UPI001661D4E2|nr:hypothetical protein [Streptomyces sp. CBMA123]MBD0694582.1 hypothetical protein [Streptomyces sp. CBMA123]